MLACACVGRDSAHIPAPRQVVRPGPVAFVVSNRKKRNRKRRGGVHLPALVAFPTPRLEIVIRYPGIRHPYANPYKRACGL